MNFFTEMIWCFRKKVYLCNEDSQSRILLIYA